MTKEVPPLAAIILAVAAFTGHLSATATSSYQARKLVSMHMSKSLEDRMEGNGAGVEADDEPVDDGTLVSTMQPGEDNESGFEKHMMDKPASAVPRSAPQQNNVTLPDMRLRLVIYYDTTFYKKFGNNSEKEIREVVKETQRIFNLPTKPWTSMELNITKIYRIQHETVALEWLTMITHKNSTDDADTYVYFAAPQKIIPWDRYAASRGFETVCDRLHLNKGGDWAKHMRLAWENRHYTAVGLARGVGRALGFIFNWEIDWDFNKTYGIYGLTLNDCLNDSSILDYDLDGSDKNQTKDTWTPCNRRDFINYYNKIVKENGNFCLNKGKGCKSTGNKCSSIASPYPPCLCDQWYYKTYCQGTGRCPCT